MLANKEKVVAFAGHRYEWHCIGLEDKLPQILEELIHNGCTVFYDGNYGAFDKKCASAVLQLKHKYPHIKLICISTYYHYDGSILPEIEELHYKQKIVKRNEWIVDNCDILVCHIEETYKSGAYRTLKYAQKQTNNLYIEKALG